MPCCVGWPTSLRPSSVYHSVAGANSSLFTLNSSLTEVVSPSPKSISKPVNWRAALTPSPILK